MSWESYLNLIKPLLPSWKFYTDYEATIMLFARVREKKDEFGEWFPLFRTPRTGFSNLFLNPEGNYTLAVHSHIQQLLHDIEHHGDKPDFDQSVSYLLTKNAVMFELKKKSFTPPYDFQFKLATVDHNRNPVEDIMLSPPLTDETT